VIDEVATRPPAEPDPAWRADEAMPGDGDDPGAASPVTGSPLVRRLWGAGLLAHVAVLLVLLVAFGALTHGGDSSTTDEGSYELQLRALDQGRWEWSSGTEALDPEGAHFPIAFAAPTDDGFAPLPKHPTWPWLALQVSRVTGVGFAFAVLGGLSVLLGAVAAWLLAAERDRAWSRAAFWIAGLAPVAVTASIGWAHAATTAAAGFAVLGAVRLVRHGVRPGPVALLVGGLSAGVLFRTEGVLVAAAVAGALFVAARTEGRPLRWGAAASGGVLVLGVLVSKAEGVWVKAITGAGSTTFNPRSGKGDADGFVQARFTGLWRSTFEPGGAAVGRLLVVATIAAALVALFVGRGDAEGADADAGADGDDGRTGRDLTPAWQVASVVVLVLLALRFAVGPTDTFSGVLPAWPVALVGLAAAGWAVVRRLSLESTFVVLFAGAIVATQYADGGAVQWGGRFFSPLVVPVAVLAAAGAVRLAARPSASSVPTAALVMALAVLPTVMGVAITTGSRHASERQFAEVDAAVEGVVLTPNDQRPRMMWRHDIRWLTVAGDDGGDDLAAVLDELDGQQVPTATILVGPGARPLAAAALERSRGWRVAERRPAGGLTAIVLDRRAD
jgi:hypothetical protein